MKQDIQSKRGREKVQRKDEINRRQMRDGRFNPTTSTLSLNGIGLMLQLKGKDFQTRLKKQKVIIYYLNDTYFKHKDRLKVNKMKEWKKIENANDNFMKVGMGKLISKLTSIQRILPEIKRDISLIKGSTCQECLTVLNVYYLITEIQNM